MKAGKMTSGYPDFKSWIEAIWNLKAQRRNPYVRMDLEIEAFLTSRSGTLAKNAYKSYQPVDSCGVRNLVTAWSPIIRGDEYYAEIRFPIRPRG